MPGQRHEPDQILETGDLEIGAVELKDADSAARANIKAANTARTTATVVLAAQAIDAAGAVLKTSAIEGGVGAAADAAATAGSAGSLSAKLRLATTQLSTIDADTGAIKTAVEANVLASKTLLYASFNASVNNTAYLEIAPDPAAATAIKIVELSLTQTVQGLTSIWTETGGTPVQEAAEWYFPAYGGIVLQMSQQPHIIASQANENIGLKNETGSTCLYSGHVVYYLEA